MIHIIMTNYTFKRLGLFSLILVLQISLLGQTTLVFAAETAQTESNRFVPIFLSPGHGNEAIADSVVSAPVDNFSAGSVAVYDLGYSAGEEIIIGSGFDEEPTVSIFNDSGELLTKFNVYNPGMKQGVNVAAGDIDGDGQAEIVIGTRPGAAPHVLVLDVDGRQKIISGGFFPYERNFRGGVSVAVGDVDGDGLDEIITAAGPGGEPRVRVWEKNFSSPTFDFLAFDQKSSAGMNVATGDIDGDGHDEIITALSGRGEPLIRIFTTGDLNFPVKEIKLGDEYSFGLNLAATDMDDNGRAEVVVTSNGSGGQPMLMIDEEWKVKEIFPVVSDLQKGTVLVAFGSFGETMTNKIFTVSSDRAAVGRPTEPKSVSVSIRNQRLHAYEYGREVNSFLVSTGTEKMPTPLGNFSVLAKKPTVLYRWSYGTNHPDNYDLGVVPWNLLIMPHIYIHYAPWHNNFGRRVSHGCVNVNLKNIKWIYDWAEVGMPVDVVE